RPRCCLETAAGNAGEETVERLFLVHAERGIVISAHAGIRDVTGAAIENLMVSRRAMRVRADHRARPAVDKVPETHLFRCRLGMEIEDDGISLLAERACGKFTFGCLERIVEIRMHEYLAHDVGYHHPRAISGDIQSRTPPRRAGGIIGRAQELLFPVGE